MATNIREALLSVITALIVMTPASASDNSDNANISSRAAAVSGVPSNYIQIGTKNGDITNLFYNPFTHDFYTHVDGKYYGLTKDDKGIRAAIQVNNGTYREINWKNTRYGYDGVYLTCTAQPAGEYAQVTYNLTNTNTKSVVVSLGMYMDTTTPSDSEILMPLDSESGAVYGLSVTDPGHATIDGQYPIWYQILFGKDIKRYSGAGLSSYSLTSPDDFWMGKCNMNTSQSAMVGNYETTGDNYMVGSNPDNSTLSMFSPIDGGMGWCWKNRTIPAGESVSFSYLIGMGDLKPTSGFNVTLDNSNAWNETDSIQTLTISGYYQHPQQRRGHIVYSVDNGSSVDLTDDMESGTYFRQTISTRFDKPSWSSVQDHYIYFTIVDENNQYIRLNPLIFRDIAAYDVSTDKSCIYDFGNPVKPSTSDVTVTRPKTGFVIPKFYNVSNHTQATEAGKATFRVEGMFPYYFGYKEYETSISPYDLAANRVSITVPNSFHLRKTGHEHRPEWKWSNSRFDGLVNEKDYSYYYNANVDQSYDEGEKECSITVNGHGNLCNNVEGYFYVYDRDKDLDITVTCGDDAMSWDTGEIRIFSNDLSLIFIDKSSRRVFPAGSTLPAGKYDISVVCPDNHCCTTPSDTLKIRELTVHAIDKNDSIAVLNLYNRVKFDIYPEYFTDSIEAIFRSSRISYDKGRVTGLYLAGLGLKTVPEEVGMLDSLQCLYLYNNELSGDIREIINHIPTAVTELNLSGNSITGNVSEITDHLPRLNWLDVSYNKFTTMTSPLPEDFYNFECYNQEPEIELDLAKLNTGEPMLQTFAGLMPSILLYQHYARSFAIPYEINLSSYPSGLIYNDFRIGRCSVTSDGILFVTEPPKNMYRGQSGDILPLYIDYSYIDEYGYSSSDGPYRLDVRLLFPQGDVNFNGAVEVNDLQMSINSIFGRSDSTVPFNFTAADLWEDETLNVQDIVMHTNILTGYRPEADNATRRVRSLAVDDADAARVYCRDGQLIIDSPVAVAAFDIVVTGNSAQLTAQMRSLGFTAAVAVKDGYAHIVGYSLSGAEIPAGQYAVADVDDAARAYSCTLSDIEANIIPSATGQFTGIDGIAANGTAVHLDGNSLYLTTAKGGHTRWSVHTIAGTLIAAGECETVAGTNLLTTLDSGTTAVAIVTVETDGERIVAKAVTNP
ncbi:MAG: protein phosphatase 1 regulatory subunit 42 [Pseudoflavonifractor sp.]|nr:protein phosphatase 1 regulatory subunit 42 [Pseudoflavonifractor sp.]